MNRRKAIFAVLCGIAGKFTLAQDPKFAKATGLVANMTIPQYVSLDLKTITKFVFINGDQKVELTAEEIWKELQP